ncbi:hypothetical protein PsorP6_013725 [Peronosclerospora sorghi]|uniref:Uncharacterized protein n=1 Tax=Peronosclerospora sorghi TaxID=230839 RepID=A0ACC0VIU1_9STRA|nr:hypothetical protein PsorP6_013725 [Peronosclerospora sorghi]
MLSSLNGVCGFIVCELAIGFTNQAKRACIVEQQYVADRAIPTFRKRVPVVLKTSYHKLRGKQKNPAKGSQLENELSFKLGDILWWATGSILAPISITKYSTSRNSNGVLRFPGTAEPYTPDYTVQKTAAGTIHEIVRTVGLLICEDSFLWEKQSLNSSNAIVKSVGLNRPYHQSITV